MTCNDDTIAGVLLVATAKETGDRHVIGRMRGPFVVLYETPGS